MKPFKPSLLTPRGRIRRKTFWIGVAILFAVEVAFAFAPTRLLEETSYLVTTYPWICLYAKRLHDLDRSGRFQIVAWLATAPATLIDLKPLWIELLYGAQMAEVAEMASEETAAFAWSMNVAVAVSLAFILYLGIARGSPGPNRYGPAPGAAPIEEIFA